MRRLYVVRKISAEIFLVVLVVVISQSPVAVVYFGSVLLLLVEWIEILNLQ